MSDIKHCIRCKSTQGLPDKPYSRYKQKEYYLCTNCNTERLKKYRQTAKGRKVFNSAAKAYYEKNKHKAHARYKAKSIPSKPCEKCGSEENLEKHHPDYSKPLEVIHLCRAHHRELHRQLKAQVL